jgi:hypothetical protein
VLTEGLGLWRGESFSDLADLDLHPASATTKGVNKLVARNCIEPGHHWRVIAPCMALHVKGKQCFLHNILRVDSAPHNFTLSEATHEASRTPEKFAIGSFIPCDCGSQQPGKFTFLPCIQVELPPKFVCVQ